MPADPEALDPNMPSKALTSALRKVVRPLVLLLVRKNIPLKFLIDTLKELYVEVAEESLMEESGKITDSQISLMTGVHRKDVRAIRHGTRTQEAIPATLSASAELLAVWLANPAYQNTDGTPATLPYAAADKNAPSFSSLSEGISTDIRPRAFLDELRRQGLVEYNEKGNLVALKADAFVPEQDMDEKLYYFGKNTGDHIAAAVHNISGQKPLLFDRSVYFDGLTTESLDVLRRLSAEVAMDMLHQINRKAFELAERDKGRSGALWRFNLGTFFYTDAATLRSPKNAKNNSKKAQNAKKKDEKK